MECFNVLFCIDHSLSKLENRKFFTDHVVSLNKVLHFLLLWSQFVIIRKPEVLYKLRGQPQHDLLFIFCFDHRSVITRKPEVLYRPHGQSEHDLTVVFWFDHRSVKTQKPEVLYRPRGSTTWSLVYILYRSQVCQNSKTGSSSQTTWQHNMVSCLFLV